MEVTRSLSGFIEQFYVYLPGMGSKRVRKKNKILPRFFKDKDSNVYNDRVSSVNPSI